MKLFLIIALFIVFTNAYADSNSEIQLLKNKIKDLELQLKHCKEGLNLPGRSYGGILRSGPSMEYPQIASLKYMQKLTLVKKDDHSWNGFNWFKVKTSSGMIGYQWGGILCSTKNQQVGLYKMCNKKYR